MRIVSEQDTSSDKRATHKRFTFYKAAMLSPYYVTVRRRIFRQLVESMLFEGIVAHTVMEGVAGTTWTIAGMSLSGQPVVYAFDGTRRHTFGRIRMNKGPVIRQAEESASEAESIGLFLLEIAGAIGADEQKVLHFIQELEQTLINDTMAQYKRHQEKLNLHELPYDDWESGIMDGHPYHPSYKSRIGFDMSDQQTFGPEFAEPIAPLWVAIRRERAQISHSFGTPNPGSSKWLQDQLGEQVLDKFTARIRQAGVDPDQYILLPVHPWQWRVILTSVLAADIHNHHILPLGSAEEFYTAQQSIRTLANRTAPSKAYLKLPLSILNTSTGRVLAPHTVANAPIITDWLKRITSHDPYLRDELRVILLGEVAGISYDNSHIPSPLQPKSYGALACIWRESIHTQLEKEESAIPFNALCALDTDERPFIAPWIERYGIERWLDELLKASISPIIHFLYAHGIALESHAQNMALVHREGLPVRVALKDFHDGIRFTRDGLSDAADCPDLVQTPEYHQRINRNSFIETPDFSAVRDFVHDAFFFINLGELAIFLQEQFGLDEITFWNKARLLIEQYQMRFPEHNERYSQFYLFEPLIGVEQLTARRLFPDTELRIHQVANPLSRHSS
ncbi:IucA/IucC family protein [Bacillus sp. FJAT-26390]|uniref:IucA/IucC family protein n=1 Tax=Bacillus sp. FJAT-26390 TaxID=1743142 RepID=UPI000AC1C2DA|nr:IucA/IucC family protein [Bacillus sp. FJAT-26390]